MNAPWKWSESGLQLLDSTGRAVLTIRPSDATEEEFNAIEAAPELLASVRELLPFAERDVKRLTEQMVGGLYPSINAAMIGRARAALAKVRMP